MRRSIIASICPRLTNYFLAALIIFLPINCVCAQNNKDTNNTSKQGLTLSDSSKNNNNKTVQIVDIAAVSIDDPAQAIKTISIHKPSKTIKCDIFIAGGGLGGVAAALKIWQMNEQQKSHRPLTVVIAEETDWLGGQATAQGVSALDENYLVESTGCTTLYQQLRHAIRNNYKSNHQLSQQGIDSKYFNPGTCWVSRLSFEPKIALEEIDTMLSPALLNSSLQVLCRHKAYCVQHRRRFFPFQTRTGGAIKSVYLTDLVTGEPIAVRAKVFLDATELGDLIALAPMPYKSGVESKDDTQEPHAPKAANADNVQDFTYPFALELCPGENHTISKPPLYEDFVQQGKFSFDNFKMYATVQMPYSGGVQELLPFWTYRRLIDTTNFFHSDTVKDYPHDIAMINWSSNDVRLKNIIDQTALTQAEHLAYGKLKSLGFLYWLQTAAPRDDGGIGYPELMLRPDIMGTTDGLSKFPYIRESRRAVTKYTVVEQDIAAAFNKQSSRAKDFTDSVGIGLYPIDIHGQQDVPGVGQNASPFQIPLGSLIPQKYNGLLPACKNIGVTHITNGAYRLHPIEWAIGEAQGALSHYCLQHKVSPEEVLANRALLRDFQCSLVEAGVPIYWFDDLPLDHPAFAAAQYLAVCGIMPGDKAHLQFFPDKAITPDEAINICYACGLKEPIKLPSFAPGSDSLTRAQFAIWLYGEVKSKKIFGKS